MEYLRKKSSSSSTRSDALWALLCYAKDSKSPNYKAAKFLNDAAFVAANQQQVDQNLLTDDMKGIVAEVVQLVHPYPGVDPNVRRGEPPPSSIVSAACRGAKDRYSFCR